MKNYIKAAILVSTSALFFSFYVVLSKETSYISPLQRMFFVNTIIFIILGVKIFIEKDKYFIPTKHNFFFLTLRALLGFLAVYFSMFSLKNSDVSTAAFLKATSPMFAVLGSFILFKDKMKPTQIIAFAITTFGIVLLLNPSIDEYFFYNIFALLSGMSAGFAYTCVRKLKNAASSQYIVLYFSGFSILMSGLFILINQEKIMDFNLKDNMYILAMAMVMLIGQICLGNGYKYAPPSKVSIYGYVQTLFNVLFAIVIFNENLSSYIIFAGILIIGGLILNNEIERLRYKKETLQRDNLKSGGIDK